MCVQSSQDLVDHLNHSANNENCQVRKMVTYPSTFVGSPRYMMQNSQDSISVVSSKGKLDLFITMTCNSNWREIRDNLLSGQQASERPDICTLVFHLKKEEFNTINYNGCKCFYIDDPGGSGEIFVYKTIYNILKSRKKCMLCGVYWNCCNVVNNGKKRS